MSRAIAAVDHWFAFEDILKTEEGDWETDQEWKVGGRKVFSKRGAIDTNARMPAAAQEGRRHVTGGLGGCLDVTHQSSCPDAAHVRWIHAELVLRASKPVSDALLHSSRAACFVAQFRKAIRWTEYALGARIGFAPCTA